jgi:hypothetical protein
MSNDPFGPLGPPQDHFRPKESPPWSAQGGGPKPPQPPTAGKGPDAEKGGFGFGSSKPPQPLTLKHYIILGAVAVPVIAFIVTMAVWQNRQRAWEQTNFGAAMDEYLSPTVAATGATPSLGKAVMVNADKRELDYLQESLPPEIRAATPAEVQTVVQLRYTDQEVGKYTGGGKAIKVTVAVTAVDKASNVVLGTKSFTSADPPLIVTGSGNDDVRGTLPIADIKAYLLGLRKS